MLLKSFPDKNTFCSLATDYNVVPVCVEILADMETPVSLLKKCKDSGGPVFLLESVEGGERWGRYSFLGMAAQKQIKVFKETVNILENGNKESSVSHDGDPIAVLKEFMNQYNPAPISELPRFWGGMTGYITYEMVSFFENIENKLPADKPLAHFIVPEELLIFDNVKNTLSCVIPCFIGKDGDPEAIYDRAQKRIEGILEKINTPYPDIPAQEKTANYKPTPVFSADEYRKNVRKTKEYIFEGDIIQAVIAQPFECEAPSDISELYRAQRYINPSPYMYFMDYGQTALVGSSPEVMVRLENGVASLRPIAGTRPRGANEQEDRKLADELLADEKEKAEHLMLVDLGRNDLGRIAQTGSVQVTDLMVIEKYSHVMHLVSNIHCDINDDLDAFDLLKAAFPAGTLSGAPKVRAMEIISELEKEPRGPYGGAVGYFSFNGNMDLAITIRTAIIENGKLSVKAGAGIVADSDPETERMETINKAKSIERALSLLSGNKE